MPDVEIRPLLTASSGPRPMSALVAGSGAESIVVSYLAFYVRSGDTHILVDTGVSSVDGESPLRAGGLVGPVLDLVMALEDCGVGADDIDFVINTHLHWDHCGNNTSFPRAKAIVQREELRYAAAPFPPHRRGYGDSRAGTGGGDHAVAPFQRCQLHPVDGDVVVAPGVVVVASPGHTPGSQSVVVSGSRSYALAGDNVPTYDNLPQSNRGEFSPNPIYVDLGSYYRSMARLDLLADVIIPSHDGRVLDRAVYS